MLQSIEQRIYEKSPAPTLHELRDGMDLLVQTFGKRVNPYLDVKTVHIGFGYDPENGTCDKVWKFESTWNGNEGCIGVSILKPTSVTKNEAEPSYEVLWETEIYDNPYSAQTMGILENVRYGYTRELSGNEKKAIGKATLQAWEIMSDEESSHNMIKLNLQNA